MFDGRFVNNAWLQEAPDPITKLTWDNAALLSPATAKKLGVGLGDVISIERNGRKVEGPVMVQPGQADDTVVIAVGYGRTKVGQVGEGPGSTRIRFARRIRSDTERDSTSRKPAALIRWRARRNTTIRKSPSSPASRTKLRVRWSAKRTIEEYKKEPNFANEMVEHPPLSPLYGDYDYSKGQQWAMAIDLNACIGCNACMVACVAENNIGVVGKEQVARGREMHWIRLDRYYTGSVEEPQAVTAPVTCMQCETAPCENVCPVAATVHSPEGLNDMVYNRCVGTRYCSNNCPYKVRRFNFLNWHKNEAEVTEDGVQPRGDGSHARRDGKVHVLRAAHPERQDPGPNRESALAEGRRSYAGLRASLPGRVHRLRQCERSGKPSRQDEAVARAITACSRN